MGDFSADCRATCRHEAWYLSPGIVPPRPAGLLSGEVEPRIGRAEVSTHRQILSMPSPEIYPRDGARVGAFVAGLL